MLKPVKGGGDTKLPLEFAMQFGTLIRSILFFGIRDSLRALRYGIYRDRLNRRYQRAIHQEELDPRPPGSLRWIRPIPHGAKIKFDQADLELLFLAPDVLRITWRPGDLPIPYAITGNDWPGDLVQYQSGEAGHSLHGSQLKVEVKPSGMLSIRDSDDELLRVENPPTRTGRAWEQDCPLDPQARIFGLGERACGWDLRGGTYRLWNQDPGGSYGVGHDPLYTSIPVYMCLQPGGHYLLFHENAHHGQIMFGEAAEVRFDRGALRSYFFSGPPDRTLERYTQLTGRSPMPPRWALGYHQSRWGYRNQDEIRQIAEQFKRHLLPISVIHLDIDYMDGYRVFTFDPERFKDVKELSQALEKDDVRLVAILDPGVKLDRGYPTFQQGLRQGMFCTLPNGKPLLGVVWPGWVHFPDFTDPTARAWWGGQYPELLDAGIAGVWHDMNEPTAFAAWGDKTLPLATRHALDGQGGDHVSGHNLYGLLMNRAGFEALREHQPEHRPWLLSRAGFAGSQRYAWNWTGDIETSWGALEQSIATMLGVCMSGFAFTGSDVGGFSGDPDPELYLRWFQFGAFSPFFRTHSAIGNPPREPWNFEPAILDAARDILEMRYRLIPYLYTLAWFASQRGAPLMRPMFWYNPQNPALWGIADQYFLGPDLLVAPVLDEGLRQREVHLPEGLWYDLWTGEPSSGPGVRTIPADLSRIPVLVRGGAILPFERSDNTLELHLYLPEQGELQGVLYSDIGDGHGPFRLDRFAGYRQANNLQLTRTGEGEFAWPYNSLRLVLHGAKIGTLRMDGEAVNPNVGDYEIGLFDALDIELA